MADYSLWSWRKALPGSYLWGQWSEWTRPVLGCVISCELYFSAQCLEHLLVWISCALKQAIISLLRFYSMSDSITVIATEFAGTLASLQPADTPYAFSVIEVMTWWRKQMGDRKGELKSWQEKKIFTLFSVNWEIQKWSTQLCHKPISPEPLSVVISQSNTLSMSVSFSFSWLH